MGSHTLVTCILHLLDPVLTAACLFLFLQRYVDELDWTRFSLKFSRTVLKSSRTVNGALQRAVFDLLAKLQLQAVDYSVVLNQWRFCLEYIARQQYNNAVLFKAWKSGRARYVSCGFMPCTPACPHALHTCLRACLEQLLARMPCTPACAHKLHGCCHGLHHSPASSTSLRALGHFAPSS